MRIFLTRLILLAAICMLIGVFASACSSSHSNPAANDENAAITPTDHSTMMPYQTADGAWMVPRCWTDSMATPADGFGGFDDPCKALSQCWTNACFEFFNEDCIGGARAETYLNSL